MLRIAHELHRAGIGIHVRKLDIGIIGIAHRLHHLAPQDPALHHIGLFHGAHAPIPLAREIEGGAGDPIDLALGIALGVDAHPLAVFLEDAARLSEIAAGCQLAHDHDVEARNHLGLQGRETGQRVEALRRAQIGEEIHLLAQAQKPPLGLDREIEVVIGRAAHGAEKHGIHFLRLRHGFIGERHAMGIIGRPPHKIFADIEVKAAFCAEPFDDLVYFGHDLGADAIAGKDEERRVCHGFLRV